MALLAVMSLGGCGYLDGGHWEDDPGNWQRAFFESKPAGIELLHSRYMNTAHWTDEFEYFFVLRGNDAARERFFGRGRLKPYESADELWQPVGDFFDEKPDWFLPKPLHAYDVYILKEEPRNMFRLFIDRETGAYYLTDHVI